MADWNKIESQIEKLIDLANTTTGKQETNLTDSINALAKGYGQGENELTAKASANKNTVLYGLLCGGESVGITIHSLDVYTSVSQ